MDMTTAITATATRIKPTPVSAAKTASVLAPYLRSSDNSWSIGIYGAIGEFMFDDDEPCDFHHEGTSLSAVTARGGLFLSFPDQLYLRAERYESSCAQSYVQRMEVLMSTENARLPVHKAIHELEEDERGTLFDTGLGSPWLQFCVRSEDPALTKKLREVAGQGLFAPGNTIMHDLHAASPARVLRSAVGRLEVYGQIPSRGERSPAAPHTHLLPKLLAKEQSVVSDGFVPVLNLYPASAEYDKYGQARDFVESAQQSFDELIASYGRAPEPVPDITM